MSRGKFLLLFVICLAFSASAFSKETKKSHKNFYNEARQFIGESKFDEAVESLEKALTLKPNKKEYIQLLDTTKKQAAQSHFDKGKAYYENHDFDKGIEELEKSLKFNSDQKVDEFLKLAENEKECESLLNQSKTSFESKDYPNAYERIIAALKVIPGKQELLNQKKKVVEAWTNSLYQEGLSLSKSKDDNTKVKSIEKFEKNLALDGSFSKAADEIRKVKADLSEYLQAAENALQEAKTKNTVEAYEAFIKKYPSVPQVEEAWELISKCDISLGQGVTLNIEEIRLWESSFDNGFPWEPYIDRDFPQFPPRSITDDMLVRPITGELELSFDPELRSRPKKTEPRPITDNLRISFGYKFSPRDQDWVSHEKFSMVIEGFGSDSPYKTAPKPAPKGVGRFWNLLLRFKNKSEQESTLWLHARDEKGFDAGLILAGEKEVGVRAFAIPGVPLYYINWIKSFTGRLGVKLEPGKETWLRLWFDVPKEYDMARFRLKGVSVPIRLPDAKKGDQY